MKKTTKTTKSNGGNKLAIGAGVAALVAAAAGTYFLYGTEKGAKTRKQIRGWALKAKGEVLEQLEGLSDVSEDAYRGIVEKVVAEYQRAKELDASDVAAFVSDMEAHWKDIVKAVAKVGGSTGTKKGKR